MPRRILILESEPAPRLAIFAAIRRLAPGHEVMLASTADEFAAAMIAHGSEIELIALGDGGELDGPKAAASLASMPATAFVIVHSSNPTTRTWLAYMLRKRGWPVASTDIGYEPWSATLWKVIDKGWIGREDKQS